MPALTKDIQLALGISEGAARLYLAALQENPATLTQLSRRAQISRTVIGKPLNELLELGIFTKRAAGKRLLYYPIGPQDWPLIAKRRDQAAKELSRSLLQQISVPSDLHIKWYGGISGIETAIREFFLKSRCKFFRQFENPSAFDYVGRAVGDFAVQERIKTKKANRCIFMGDGATNSWMRDHLENNEKELREVIFISPSEYPFEADVAISDNMALVFEYKNEPFAILIENETLARAMSSIHQMIWDRYRLD